jgi:hypothetical protein
LCTAGRKALPRALELFLQGLTAPTLVCSAITAATYKKYALVSLIHAGALWCAVLCCAGLCSSALGITLLGVWYVERVVY